MTANAGADTAEDAWNPGLQSSIPSAYLPLSSLFQAESISNDLREINELRGFCGLAPELLVEFRAERLIVHETLIRMTANVEVADGPNYEDLGFTFRAMVRRVLDRHIAAHVPACVELLQSIKREAAEHVLHCLRPPQAEPHNETAEGWAARFASIWRRSATPVQPQAAAAAEAGELAQLERWRQKAETAPTEIERESLEALVTVASAIAARQGRLVGDPSLIAKLAARLVGNDYGSRRIGALIDEPFRLGVLAEGFRLLPVQAQPYVMNIKGASASGKSSMRPLQRALAGRLGVPWSDFSLISPDIWRKFLLSYESLGPAFKYAGALSAHELEIVDRKLDRYVAEKNEAGRLTHLLIDRFRFDSFVPEAEVQVNSKLLTRFGSHVFLHFMVTPPEATVERAWLRGKQVGRYKAVDDLLAHNIEAFSGMPELFFTWALSRTKRVHYEFLDNSVPHGQTPRTIAFGINGEMNILDVEGMLNVERYRHVNIQARRPADVYTPAVREPVDDLAFIQRCIAMLAVVNLADPDTGEVYARFEAGTLTFVAPDAFARANLSLRAAAAADALLQRQRARGSLRETSAPPRIPITPHTIGAWGPRAARVGN